MTTSLVASIPYLNSLPFYSGLQLGDRFALNECMPRQSAQKAAAGELTAALMPLAGFLRNRATFDRLGHFGIAAKGRAHSTILFSRRPIRQLDGAVIGVSDETSTTVCLTRLILEQRYKLIPGRYRRGVTIQDEDLDAILLIGDEALRFKQTNGLFPFEIDVAFEWWLWQHLPAVFAVWAVRKDTPPGDRKRLESGIARALTQNSGPALEQLAEQAAPRYNMKKEEVHAYLSSFAYRFGKNEEEGIARLTALWEEHGLLNWDPA